MPGPVRPASISELLAGYRSGALTPSGHLASLAGRLAAQADDGIWITTVPARALVARAAALEAEPGAAELPLFGVPFAVKDSLDVAGLPTTVACPAYAHSPDRSSEVVRALEAAGAICVGKTNLDQFATGLNGTRTPYGVPRSVYGGDLISGGSSSGSALAVATGVVPFAVATDTAGSGRVPAALNGILGYKPSRGLISTVGLVPACRSLDCVSLMAACVDDLRRVMDVVAAEPDERDPWSRPRSRSRTTAPRIGLPDPASLPFGHPASSADDPWLRAAHVAATAAVSGLGGVVEVYVEPFLAAGRLLYAGPWVAERTLEFGDFVQAHPGDVLPVIAEIITGGARFTAVDAFAAQYELAALRAQVARLWQQVDVVVLPVIPTTFTVAQVLADPVATNTTLGTYTQSGNLLDLCGVVVPTGTTSDGRPVAAMILGPALADETVLLLASRWQELLLAEPDRTEVLVAGHHLSGGPRNHELTALGGRLEQSTTTSEGYRLLRLGEHPGVPALLPADSGGAAIEVEVWSLPAAHLDRFLAGVPEVLALGRVELADGRRVPGLVRGPSASTSSASVTDITSSGGWRAHLRSPAPSDAQHAPPPPPAPPTPGAPVTVTVPADPGPFSFSAPSTALLIIDMQRDFLLPGGFGESLGNDVSQLARVVPPLVDLLDAVRAAGMLVIHTREGHLPDLSDCPPAKLHRAAPSRRIGDPGPGGRILIRGEHGHDIIDELAPREDEVVIDKPGKGAFHATDLAAVLDAAGITSLIVTGVTTEVCVHTTVREANDRGYEALVVSDCTGSYFPEFQRVGLAMIAAQGGIFGWVADSAAVREGLSALTPASTRPLVPSPVA